MSLSATLFGTDSLIFKATNILGLGIPGLLHKTFGPGEPEAQRLGEISRQTAKEGDPRVIVWGRVRPIGGNIIHCQEPKKRMVKQSSSGGGKGGGKKKEQKVEHVFRTYAIGVCEGPITGFSRIWRNNKLVYDARGNAWGEKNNPVFLKTFRLYLGGWGQMPDPTLQSIWGAGNVPAYRGTAYMVSIDEDLTEMGGSVPQWQFEVERAEGIYYTSKPYAMEDEQEVAGAISVRRLRDPFWRAEADDELDGGIAVQGLEFRSSRVEQNQGYEAIDGGIAVQGLEFRSSRVEQDQGHESLDGDIAVQDLVFRIGLIEYQDPAVFEAIDGGIAVQGLSHATV
ncbi:hypothetical protein OMD46_16355 [Pseudomonas sp. MDMC_285]|nr:hypothetical protein [Pseudomonas sp. MDMC_285]